MNTTTSPASQPQALTDMQTLDLIDRIARDAGHPGLPTDNVSHAALLAALAARPATAAAGVPDLATMIGDSFHRQTMESTDQSVTEPFKAWLDSVHIRGRQGVAGNEAWNAGVAWQLAQTATQPASGAVEPAGGEVLTDTDWACIFSVWWAHNKSKFTTPRQASMAAMAHARIRATPAQPAPAPGVGKGEHPRLTMSMFANRKDFEAAGGKREDAK